MGDNMGISDCSPILKWLVGPNLPSCQRWCFCHISHNSSIFLMLYAPLLVLVSSLIFGNLLMLSPYLRKAILSIVYNNYHPISLLCCISKLFENLIFNHIYSYLRCHRLIIEYQSGFTQADSTINQLIAICNKL